MGRIDRELKGELASGGELLSGQSQIYTYSCPSLPGPQSNHQPESSTYLLSFYPSTSALRSDSTPLRLRPLATNNRLGRHPELQRDPSKFCLPKLAGTDSETRHGHVHLPCRTRAKLDWQAVDWIRWGGVWVCMPG